MKLKIHVVISLMLILMAPNLYADNDEDKIQENPRHPAWPVILGAGLISWGAYELGEDSDEGRRNVKILWGGAALSSAGIILYQWRQEKGKTKELSVKSLDDTPVLSLSVKY